MSDNSARVIRSLEEIGENSGHSYHYISEELAYLASERESERMQQSGEDFTGDFACSQVWTEGENCKGWDGYSSRCDRGNRKVCWTVYEYNDKTWGFYACHW